jgi:hypothetical protein
VHEVERASLQDVISRFEQVLHLLVGCQLCALAFYRLCVVVRGLACLIRAWQARAIRVGATGFEPATFRPPAERIQVSMCLGASVVSYASRAVDDLDR